MSEILRERYPDYSNNQIRGLLNAIKQKPPKTETKTKFKYVLFDIFDLNDDNDNKCISCRNCNIRPAMGKDFERALAGMVLLFEGKRGITTTTEKEVIGYCHQLVKDMGISNPIRFRHGYICAFKRRWNDVLNKHK